MANQPPDAATVAVVAAYQQQTQALRDQIEKYIRSLWKALGLYREPQMRDFAKEVLPVVLGAQRHMATMTASYLAVQRQVAIGSAGVPVAVDIAKVTGSSVRNGASMDDVYGRPFHLVWRQLDELPRIEGSIDKAIKAGEDRAVTTALTDLQLAKTYASQKAVSTGTQVTGYRRVLEGAKSCGLCIVASTQRYHKKQLLPIHPGCDCSVVEIYPGQDPEQLIDPRTLADVHDRIAERFGADSSAARTIPGARNAKGQLIQYRDVLITHDHGELGPVLAVRGAPFLGPSDI